MKVAKEAPCDLIRAIDHADDVWIAQFVGDGNCLTDFYVELHSQYHTIWLSTSTSVVRRFSILGYCLQRDNVEGFKCALPYIDCASVHTPCPLEDSESESILFEALEIAQNEPNLTYLGEFNC